MIVQSSRDLDMERFERITSNPAVMNGKPCIRGTRLTVRRVVESVGSYPDRAKLKREFPELADEDIAQAPSFAAHCVDHEAINLRAS